MRLLVPSAPLAELAPAATATVADSDLIKAHSARQPSAAVLPPAPPRKSPGRRCLDVFTPQNVGDMGGVLDPAAIVLLLLFCLGSFAIGAYKMATDKPGEARRRCCCCYCCRCAGGRLGGADHCICLC